MDRSFSIYLEIARIIATLIVFLAHGSIFYQPLGDLNHDLNLGRDGVLIFFVLSGYVITWCANERDNSALDFAVNRASRIYSVAIPGIILGVIASAFTAIYTNQEFPYQFHKPWIYLPLYLTFTGSLWHITETPPGNFPYWSLNFEVWYYVIFAAFFYIRGGFRWAVIVGLMALLGPEIIELFPLWIAGSALYYFQKKLILPTNFARTILVATCVIYLLSKVAGIDSSLDQYNHAVFGVLYGGERVPHQLLGDYYLALLVAINFVAALNSNLKFGKTTERRVKIIASFSFSFYLFHIPIFTVLEALIPYTQSFAIYLLVLAGASLTIIYLARFTEHKKGAYRAFFRSIAYKLTGTEMLPGKAIQTDEQARRL